jgi:hypothetical protein
LQFGEEKPMILITVIGEWNVLKLDEQDPVEYAVTKGKTLYHNREEAAAVRLAEYLSKIDEGFDLHAV